MTEYIAEILKSQNEGWFIPIRQKNGYTSNWIVKSEEENIDYNRWVELVRQLGGQAVNKLYFFNTRRYAIQRLKKLFPDAKKVNDNQFLIKTDKIS